MAEGKSKDDAGKEFLEPDEVIKRLAPDGHPDVTRLIGIRIGTSTRLNHVRLYLTPDLKQYCEVSKESVVASERGTNGETILWVRPDTRIHFVGVSSYSAEFLEGEIQRTFLPTSVRTGGFITAMRRAIGGLGADSIGCCDPDTAAKTQRCPVGSCGLCQGNPVTFSNCQGGGGGGYPV